jgi:NhaA family Na+:H+ antiporter
MSLFIGSLAFPEADATLLFDERVGIILGSLMSGLAGYFVLRSLPRPKAQ